MTVTISKKRYYELRLAEEMLNRLQSGGVDNWDWYGDSLEDMDEFEAGLWDEIFGNTEIKYERIS